MRTKIISRAAAAGVAAGALALSLIAAPASQADEGTTSLATVLQAGQAKFDQDFRDYDILTKAVETVLAAKPDSAVSVLADGDTALTAFIPNDRAFMNLASALTGKKVKTERKAFNTVAGLGVPMIEQVLLYHVIPGSTILSQDALQANGATLNTALEGETIRVRVNTSKPSITLVDGAKKLKNPKVILSQVDINEGNKQIAHGIDAVLLPMNP